MIRSKIPSDTLRILYVFLAVVFSQEPFFAQDLTVEQPNAGHKVDQQNLIGETKNSPSKTNANPT